MSLLTNWGYTLTELTSLDDMLTEAEFNTFTASKWSGDTRISSEIAAACAAIRNYVGWHLYPSAACSMTEYLLYGNGSVKRVGDDILIQLPATYVTAVESITIGDTAYTDYVLETNGLIHVFDVDFSELSRSSSVVVVYTAGIPSTELSALKELIAHRVTHSLAVPAGVTSEAAGGVSVTYNAAWANNVRATALPDDNKEVLAPYRLRRVF